MEVSGRLHAPNALFPGKQSSVPICRKLGRYQTEFQHNLALILGGEIWGQKNSTRLVNASKFSSGTYIKIRLQVYDSRGIRTRENLQAWSEFFTTSNIRLLSHGMWHRIVWNVFPRLGGTAVSTFHSSTLKTEAAVPPQNLFLANYTLSHSGICLIDSVTGINIQ
jgi:hypothetical protein